ncbi:MAG: glycosyltransferase family 4 protein [Acidimicrobiales bacterium]|nr:glycosyltransferase family 4 protein [Acidimicrobiales bacterium]
MKILLITESLNIGGIETNIKRLSKELVDRGHEVIIAARPGVLNNQINALGVRIVDLKMSIKSPNAIIKDILKIKNCLSEVDIVHIFSAKGGLLNWLTSHLFYKKTNPKTVASLMGLQTNTENEISIKTNLRAKLTLLGADTVIVTSPAIGSVINKVKNRKQKLFNSSVVGVEVYEASSKEESEKLKKSLGINNQENLIVTIGRLSKSKSHYLFIDAVNKVIEHHPESRFLIVGDGPLRNELEDLIKKKKLTENIHLVGERYDIREILSATDIYVRPGVIEGFVGVTVLEAQSLSKPVIGFATEDLEVAITDRVSGLIVPKSDSTKLAEAICELLEDSEFAERIAKNGHQQFLKLFSIQQIVDNLCSIYYETINHQKPPRR